MWYGVDLFFTISGFLITSILLNARFATNPHSKPVILKSFFIKRALRLFPVYYLFVFLFIILYYCLHIHIWKPEYNPYFLTYFQNIYYFKQGAFNSQFSHFWSLGVEEQFYMVWPFIILFFPRRILPYVFGFVIIVSLFCNTVFYNVPMIRSLTFCNFHTLGIGALFAWYYTQKPNWLLFTVWIKKRMLIACISLILFILMLVNKIIPLGELRQFITESLLALTTLSFLILSIYGWPKPFSFITNNSIVKYIGKISYGIYLFHLPLPSLWSVVCTKLKLIQFIPTNVISFVIFYACLTFIIASVSYHFFEIRFLRLKEKFSD
jgi:peptidoglycan/LPS O-acetylase OafA/YrhL